MSARQQTSRLDKYLADCGYGTRSQTTRLLKKGIVTVNGKVIRKASHKVSTSDKVHVDGVPTVTEPPIYLWHKPEVCNPPWATHLGDSQLLNVSQRHCCPNTIPSDASMRIRQVFFCFRSMDTLHSAYYIRSMRYHGDIVQHQMRHSLKLSVMP